jgi:hypothetical protein
MICYRKRSAFAGLMSRAKIIRIITIQMREIWSWAELIAKAGSQRSSARSICAILGESIMLYNYIIFGLFAAVAIISGMIVLIGSVFMITG